MVDDDSVLAAMHAGAGGNPLQDAGHAVLANF